MTKRLLIVLIMVLVSFAHRSGGQEMGLIKAQAIRDNVVSIRSNYGLGFGFIVGEREGVLFIVTVNHVVRGPNDGGPNDKVNVEIEFFTERGNKYSAVLKDTWLSSRKEDLAVITITTPPRFKWRYEGFAPQRDGVEGTLVWTVGRDGEWSIAEQPGRIRLKAPDGVLEVDGFGASAVGGMSGGVIVSKDGVEGLIQSRADGGRLRAMSLQTIRKFMEAWGHPWGMRGIERKFSAQEREMATGKELVVADNAKIVVGRRDSELIVDRLVMGRKSVISFEEGVREWSIVALNASFGPGAAIDGRGWEGHRGDRGPSGNLGDWCKRGSNGGDGRDGGDGTDGVSIRMKLGIRAIDSLLVDLSGGDGGLGGEGGSGGGGGSNLMANCTAGDGGDGGHGGNGGSGGNGGVLVLDYFFLDDPQRTLSKNHIRFVSAPGDGGRSGIAGSAGTSGTNQREYTKAGRSGQVGEHGRPGAGGRRGELIARGI